jgi:hypothetical protein
VEPILDRDEEFNLKRLSGIRVRLAVEEEAGSKR